MNSLRIFFALMFLSGAFRGDQPDKDEKNVMINSLGVFNLYEGELIIKTVEDSDRINYIFTYKTKYSTRDMHPIRPPIKKDANWFLFPVSKDEVWIYEGGDSLLLYTKDTVRGIETESHVFIKNDPSEKKPPQVVLDRLPKSLRLKFSSP